MNRAISKFKIVEQATLFIEVEGSAELYVKSGDKLKKGDKLYSVERKKIVESHYIPKALGVQVQKSAEYVGRVGGEYVMEGELLAEKLTSGGLVTKRLIAGSDGIVSLRRLDMGYIDILSEANRILFDSPVNGEVEEVVLNSGIYIKSEAVKVPIFDIEGFHDIENFSQVTGVLHSIVTDHEVPSPANLEEDYEGKIVFVGQHYHRKLITELYKKGCEAIIAYSADIEAIIELGIPVVVLRGYGHIKSDEEYFEMIEKNVGEWVRVDLKGRALYIFDSAVRPKDVKANFYPRLIEGARVSSHDIDSYALAGKVLDYEGDDEKYVALMPDGSSGTSVLVNKDRLVSTR
ncbi:MAG: hypothetical protein QY318_01115 [Candidatus Dojkabacteria bacterium]|nr:MAG: hypothetical protein QY318_01115 [Candidatus Dojkabacteria bacterium]